MKELLKIVATRFEGIPAKSLRMQLGIWSEPEALLCLMDNNFFSTFSSVIVYVKGRDAEC